MSMTRKYRQTKRPYERLLVLRISAEEVDAMCAKAEQQNLTQSAFVRQAIKDKIQSLNLTLTSVSS